MVDVEPVIDEIQIRWYLDENWNRGCIGCRVEIVDTCIFECPNVLQKFATTDGLFHGPASGTFYNSCALLWNICVVFLSLCSSRPQAKHSRPYQYDKWTKYFIPDRTAPNNCSLNSPSTKVFSYRSPTLLSHYLVNRFAQTQLFANGSFCPLHAAFLRIALRAETSVTLDETNTSLGGRVIAFSQRNTFT